MNFSTHPAIVLLIASGVLAVACKEEAPPKSEPKSESAAAPESAAPEPTSAPSTNPAAAAAPPNCPGGFHANASPPFCIKVPEGYTAKEPKIISGKVGELPIGGPGTLSVAWTDTDFDSCVKQMEAEAVVNNQKIVERGDLADGGKFIRSRNDLFDYYISVTKAGDLNLSCHATYYTKTTADSVVVDACKSLVVPKG